MLKAKNRETETGPLSPTHYKAFDTKHLQRQPHNHIHTKLNSSSSTFNTTPLQKLTVKEKDHKFKSMPIYMPQQTQTQFLFSTTKCEEAKDNPRSKQSKKTESKWHFSNRLKVRLFCTLSVLL